MAPPVRVRQERTLHGVALHNGNAAVFPPLGPQGDARPAQPLHVPVDGPLVHLQPRRQLGGGGLLLPQQDGQNAD